MSAPVDPSSSKVTPDVSLKGFKKEPVKNSRSLVGYIRRYWDLSAQQTKVEVRRTKIRLTAVITLIATAFLLKAQFKNTLALSNNQAKVTDTDTYYKQRLLYGRARSRVAARLANIHIPREHREKIFKAYAKQFNAILEEARYPIDTYSSLQEFFTRTLKDNVRPLPLRNPAEIPTSVVTSPVDAQLVTLGELKPGQDRVVQVKGTNYSIRAFLGCNPDGSRPGTTATLQPAGQESGELAGQNNKAASSPAPASPKTKMVYCTLYLAPGDYHHFHAPCDFDVVVRRHFPGEMLPVKLSLATRFNDLFTVNERVVLSGKWDHGRFHYAAIAAYNVGDIGINFDPTLKTNRLRTVPVSMGGDSFVRMYENPVSLPRGEGVGVFRLGSTIVMCFEVPEDWQWCAAEGDKVRLNTVLGGTPKDLETLIEKRAKEQHEIPVSVPQVAL